MHLLLTGGAGYIGIHTAIALVSRGIKVTVFDNFSNSRPIALDLAGKLVGQTISHVIGDVRHIESVDDVFSRSKFDGVLHFAGLKSIGESRERPIDYFDVNVGGAINLLRAMAKHDVRTFVFSSSASVYGVAETMPVSEEAVTQPLHPYAESKLAVERMLHALHESDERWRIAVLRYFNPVGAHESAQVGEQPHTIPPNLMPALVDVVTGKRPKLTVFGDDYATPDGTGVRDFIHVMDLAEGHVAAVDYLQKQTGKTLSVTNLGTGRGISVLEMVREMERVSGVSVPIDFQPRRAGDVASCYADVRRAEVLFGWRATRSVTQMCEDALGWARKSNGIG
jgi:UDP-glucose 4-epimerase